MAAPALTGPITLFGCVIGSNSCTHTTQISKGRDDANIPATVRPSRAEHDWMSPRASSYSLVMEKVKTPRSACEQSHILSPPVLIFKPKAAIHL